ncbi:MAG: hypothetical protein WBG01_11490 [Bacteroidota bacterium]
MKYLTVLTCLVLIHGFAPPANGQAPGVGNLPLIKRGAATGFSTAGWKYHRHKDLQPLDAHTSVVVADIEGLQSVPIYTPPATSRSIRWLGASCSRYTSTTPRNLL